MSSIFLLAMIQLMPLCLLGLLLYDSVEWKISRVNNVCLFDSQVARNGQVRQHTSTRPQRNSGSTRTARISTLLATLRMTTTAGTQS